MLRRRPPQARRLYVDHELRELLQRGSLLADGDGGFEAVLVFGDGVAYACPLPRRLVRRLVPELDRCMDAIVDAMEADR